MEKRKGREPNIMKMEHTTRGRGRMISRMALVDIITRTRNWDMMGNG